MERRGVDILCVHETRRKGTKARCIRGEYIMWCCGSENKKNGVGIILKKDHVGRLVELWRVTDKMICLKMEFDGVILNVISAYAPQVGCIQSHLQQWRTQFAGRLHYCEKTKDQGGGGYKGYCQ